MRTPSLVLHKGTAHRKTVEWLTEEQRYDLSRNPRIVAIAAEDSIGVLSVYIDGVKRRESGELAGRHMTPDKHLGYVS